MNKINWYYLSVYIFFFIDSCYQVGTGRTVEFYHITRRGAVLRIGRYKDYVFSTNFVPRACTRWALRGLPFDQRNTGQRNIKIPYHVRVLDDLFLICSLVKIASANPKNLFDQKLNKNKSEFDKSFLLGNRVRSTALIRKAFSPEDQNRVSSKVNSYPFLGLTPLLSR